jgi:nicotinamide phosphoribosyltransferase
MKINPLLQTDFYKVGHYKQYPENTVKIYSNLTPRKSRMKGVNEVVVFGIQYFIIEYLIVQWRTSFFSHDKHIVLEKYKKKMDTLLGEDVVSVEHIGKLHDLGYLPLEIKALPEGTICPIGVPVMTITNTVDHAYWLVNYFETIISCTTWQPMTSATIAHNYRKLLNKYAFETTGSVKGVEWQGHDFSMRGMSSLESACLSGAAHLLSFNGTDTIPAIQFLEQYYGADSNAEIIGSSVPATEHSVMCMGTKDDEIGTFERLLDLYPKGILSVVSDTWDLWKVCTEYLPALRDKILARDGKLVIRPDSGDPVDIICGLRICPNEDELDEYCEYENPCPYDVVLVDDNYYHIEFIQDGPMQSIWRLGEEVSYIVVKGVIELLWDTFGGTINEQGYKVLDSHIGAIYGDSITLDRAIAICERLKAKGFASTNVVLGIGSFTYQYNTRDTFGFAVKATYGEVLEDMNDYDGEADNNGLPQLVLKGREIFKDPITDDGTKKSAKGLLSVRSYDRDGFQLYLKDQCTLEEEKNSLLKTVFLNGELVKFQKLSEIRERLAKHL